MSDKFTFEIWKDPAPGYWCYLIKTPAGEDHISGARKDTEGGTLRHVEACLVRLNQPLQNGHWKHRNIMRFLQ